MTLNLDHGCESPGTNTVRDVYRPLAEHFAPTLTFDPAERFLPVDLPSTAGASTLHKVTGDVVEGREILNPGDWNYQMDWGTGAPDNLRGKTREYFTSICPWDKMVNEWAQPPYSMPVPCTVDQIAARYTGPAATIDATLTMYATVCRPTQVPNYRGFLAGRKLEDPAVRVALDEGLLINYYCYFPAADTPWLRREG
ncbi:MAG TPA: hypothetical protein VF163_07005, partial [Micromonosporaceae bacterium]